MRVPWATGLKPAAYDMLRTELRASLGTLPVNQDTRRSSGDEVELSWEEHCAAAFEDEGEPGNVTQRCNYKGQPPVGWYSRLGMAVVKTMKCVPGSKFLAMWDALNRQQEG